ncbi:hypothetical protein PENSPDRAFT_656788 [Peniophora sp. CONT]|nr:hypothetical protein PENSPDRAFT_656788 [Peniophora sp. CONT]
MRRVLCGGPAPAPTNWLGAVRTSSYPNPPHVSRMCIPLLPIPSSPFRCFNSISPFM